jgi:hypothetical protein
LICREINGEHEAWWSLLIFDRYKYGRIAKCLLEPPMKGAGLSTVYIGIDKTRGGEIHKVYLTSSSPDSSAYSIT